MIFSEKSHKILAEVGRVKACLTGGFIEQLHVYFWELFQNLKNIRNE